MIAGIGRLHARIEGVTPDGQPYRADDPALLTWVHATAAFGFLEAYASYVQPLSVSVRDAYYREGQTAARLYGAIGAPDSQQALDAAFAAMHDTLEPSPIVFDFLRMMQTVSLLPAGLGPLQRACIKAAVALVP